MADLKRNDLFPSQSGAEEQVEQRAIALAFELSSPESRNNKLASSRVSHLPMRRLSASNTSRGRWPKRWRDRAGRYPRLRWPAFVKPQVGTNRRRREVFSLAPRGSAGRAPFRTQFPALPVSPTRQNPRAPGRKRVSSGARSANRAPAPAGHPMSGCDVAPPARARPRSNFGPESQLRPGASKPIALEHGFPVSSKSLECRRAR